MVVVVVVAAAGKKERKGLGLPRTHKRESMNLHQLARTRAIYTVVVVAAVETGASANSRQMDVLVVIVVIEAMEIRAYTNSGSR